MFMAQIWVIGFQRILETNNDIEGKPQLDFFKSLNCSITLLSDTSNDDTTGNYGRKTYPLEPDSILKYLVKYYSIKYFNTIN